MSHPVQFLFSQGGGAGHEGGASKEFEKFLRGTLWRFAISPLLHGCCCGNAQRPLSQLFFFFFYLRAKM
jgi:hypothetical protein